MFRRFTEMCLQTTSDALLRVPATVSRRHPCIILSRGIKQRRQWARHAWSGQGSRVDSKHLSLVTLPWSHTCLTGVRAAFSLGGALLVKQYVASRIYRAHSVFTAQGTRKYSASFPLTRVLTPRLSQRHMGPSPYHEFASTLLYTHTRMYVGTDIMRVICMQAKYERSWQRGVQAYYQ